MRVGSRQEVRGLLVLDWRCDVRACALQDAGRYAAGSRAGCQEEQARGLLARPGRACRARGCEMGQAVGRGRSRALGSAAGCCARTPRLARDGQLVGLLGVACADGAPEEKGCAQNW